MALPVVQQPTPAQALALGAKYGPNAGLAFQRSQYLADALQQMQASTDNLRTPANLGLHLLAQGITAWGKNKADKQAMTAYQADQADMDKRLLADTPLAAGASTPPASAPPVAPLPTPPPQQPPAAALASALAPPTQGQPDPGRLNLARMVWGEARGEPPEGQQAVAAVALNRARQSGKPLDEVLTAPHQFSGVNSRSMAVPPDQLQSILQNIAPVMDGQDPTHGADHFYNPQLASPSWGQGPGQMIGHHKFMALDGPQQGAPPMPAGAMPPPQPYQVAANGPTPPPPQQLPPPSLPAQQGPAPAPVPPSPAGAGAPAQVPHQMVTPQEWQQAASLLHDPRTRELGVQEILKLKMRAASPIEMKPGTYFDPQTGQARSVEQFQDQPGAPNAFVQRSSMDNSIHAQSNPAYGAIPSGMVMGQGGGISQVPTEQKKTFRIPGAPGLYVQDEKGNPQKVADDNYTVKDVGATMQELTGSQQYDKAAKLSEMYRGAVQAAGRPGGISDAELKDNAAQIFSGGVARQFNAKMLDEGQGPWLRLKQIAPEIASGQKLSPQARQAMVQAMHDYAVEAQTAFGGLAQSKSAFAQQNGVDLSPFIKPLMQPLPEVPNLSSIPNGISGYPGENAANPAQAQAAAIQAEIQRRKAAGVWTGH